MHDFGSGNREESGAGLLSGLRDGRCTHSWLLSSLYRQFQEKANDTKVNKSCQLLGSHQN